LYIFLVVLCVINKVASEKLDEGLKPLETTFQGDRATFSPQKELSDSRNDLLVKLKRAEASVLEFIKETVQLKFGFLAALILHLVQLIAKLNFLCSDNSSIILKPTQLALIASVSARGIA